jgi:hypothetical protein
MILVTMDEDVADQWETAGIAVMSGDMLDVVMKLAEFLSWRATRRSNQLHCQLHWHIGQGHRESRK